MLECSLETAVWQWAVAHPVLAGTAITLGGAAYFMRGAVGDYFGVRPEVYVGNAHLGDLRVAYKFYRGVIRDSLKKRNELNLIGEQYSVRTFSVFYDDPEKVKPGEFRYIVGVILSDAGVRVEQLTRMMERNGYKTYVFDTGNCAIHCRLEASTGMMGLGNALALRAMGARVKDEIQKGKWLPGPMLAMSTADQRKHWLYVNLDVRDKFIVPETFAKATPAQ